MQSTRHVDGQILVRSQGLTKKDLLYIIGPAERDGLYVTNKIILIVLYVGRPITTFWLTYPLFWL